jgi:hypothetical protein
MAPRIKPEENVQIKTIDTLAMSLPQEQRGTLFLAISRLLYETDMESARGANHQFEGMLHPIGLGISNDGGRPYRQFFISSHEASQYFLQKSYEGSSIMHDTP